MIFRALTLIAAILLAACGGTDVLPPAPGPVTEVTSCEGARAVLHAEQNRTNRSVERIADAIEQVNRLCGDA